MRLFIHIVCLLGILSAPCQLMAQDAAADLQKVNDYVNKSKILSLELEYRVFASWESTKPVEVSLSTIKKRGDESYLSLSHLEMLQATNYSVAVNTQSKSMQIASKQKSETPVQKDMDYKALLASCKSVIYKRVSDEKATYTLNAEVGYKKTIIAFHPKTFRPISAEVHYLGTMKDDGTMDESQNKKMIILYNRVDRQPLFGKSDFDYSKFFTVVGQKYLPTANYKGYTINGKLIN